MDNIGDILSGRKIDEPAEVQIIKRFIRETFKANSEVTIRTQQIIIGVSSASLAGALRVRLSELKALCDSNKRFVIRIVSR